MSQITWLALYVAKKATGKKAPIGECSGRNYLGFPFSIHAEIDSYRKLVSTLSPHKSRGLKVDLCVMRFSKTGVIGSSRPCINCLLFLARSKLITIRYVYYSTEEGKVAREKFSHMIQSKETHISRGFRKNKQRNKKS